MSGVVSIVRALRALSRRYKLLFVLAAAWAPILLRRSPLLACSVVLFATALFFVSVSSRPAIESTQSSGTHDEES